MFPILKIIAHAGFVILLLCGTSDFVWSFRGKQSGTKYCSKVKTHNRFFKHTDYTNSQVCSYDEVKIAQDPQFLLMFGAK